jgi:asparagine synthase (glutamine-hydrolysing)
MIDGRPWNRDPSQTRWSPEHFAEALLQGPDQAFAGVGGSFAIAAVIDGQEAYVATDRFAVHPVYFHGGKQRFVFGTSIHEVARHAGVSADIDPQAIYDYLYFHVIPGPRTVYRGVHKLAPGRYARYAGGRLDLRPYWSAEFRYSGREDPRALAGELKAKLRTSVERAIVEGKLGAFLSGGLDSSTVLGLLSEVTGQPAHAFSIGFDAAGYDEMEYARLAARHFGATHHEYYVKPADVLALLPELPAAFDGPFGNSSAVPTYYCAKLARDHGIECLLAGDGGDEIFAGNARYARQMLFERYYRLPLALRRGAIEPLVQALKHAPPFPLLSKAVSYVEQASVPLPDRLESYNLLDRLNPAEMLAPEFWRTVDRNAPLRHLREVYGSCSAQAPLDRMLHLDFQLTLADCDLPKVSHAARLAGIEIEYPMLDVDLVEFSCRVPAALKLKGGRLRYFYKWGLRDYLPEATLKKSKHGFGLPFGVWFTQYEPLARHAMDLLAGLEARNVLRRGYADTLLAATRTHPPYYGTMVWVLAVLEQWLREFAPGFTIAAAA